MCTFFDMLSLNWLSGRRVCVGLDSDLAKLPAHLPHLGAVPDVFKFNREIIEATKDLVLCYKPNIAFYSGNHREASLHALKQTVQYVHKAAPNVPVILDAKRADIGKTNAGYVEEAFGEFGADAVTVNPYFGMEALAPFLERKDRGVIVLCRTSNEGAREFQDLLTEYEGVQMPLYRVVALRVARHWNKNGNCGLVVGATYPEELGQVRHEAPQIPILIPGAGAQRGDVAKSVRNGLTADGGGIIVNSSSAIIFASGGTDFAEAARLETERLTAEINDSLPARVI